MRIDKLSVDDWLALEGQPFQVIGINPPYVDLLGNGGRIRLCDIDSDNLVAIPLTEEVLKDNGFYKHTRRYCLRVGHNQISILIGACYTEVEYMNGSLSPDGVEINYSHQYEFPYVIAVHQLQHILRLAGFRKGIKL